MDKHTPGPWALGGKEGDGEGFDGYVYCNDRHGNAVAVCFGFEFRHSTLTREEQLANARLIAEAPDLLKALEAAKEALEFSKERIEELLFEMNEDDNLHYPIIDDAINFASSAIAKATGGEG